MPKKKIKPEERNSRNWYLVLQRSAAVNSFYYLRFEKGYLVKASLIDRDDPDASGITETVLSLTSPLTVSLVDHQTPTQAVDIVFNNGRATTVAGQPATAAAHNAPRVVRAVQVRQANADDVLLVFDTGFLKNAIE